MLSNLFTYLLLWNQMPLFLLLYHLRYFLGSYLRHEAFAEEVCDLSFDFSTVPSVATGLLTTCTSWHWFRII